MATAAHRLSRTSKRGMPVHVTCNEPATVFVAVDLLPGPAERRIDPKAHPGSHGWTRPRGVPAGKATKFRVKLRPYARRAIRKEGRSRILFNLGVKGDDGLYRNNPEPAGRAHSRITR